MNEGGFVDGRRRKDRQLVMNWQGVCRKCKVDEEREVQHR